MIGAFGCWTTKPVLIIRAGENARAYPDPYDSSVTVTFEEEGWATFEGFVSFGKHLGSRMKAAIEVANRMTGLPVKWMRRGANPHWLVQTSGVNGGRITMTVKKEALHDIKTIFKPDGTLNVLTGMNGLTHFLGQHAAGHVAISRGSVSVTPKGDGSEDVTISFNRK